MLLPETTGVGEGVTLNWGGVMKRSRDRGRVKMRGGSQGAPRMARGHCAADTKGGQKVPGFQTLTVPHPGTVPPSSTRRCRGLTHRHQLSWATPSCSCGRSISHPGSHLWSLATTLWALPKLGGPRQLPLPTWLRPGPRSSAHVCSRNSVSGLGGNPAAGLQAEPRAVRGDRCEK